MNYTNLEVVIQKQDDNILVLVNVKSAISLEDLSQIPRDLRSNHLPTSLSYHPQPAATENVQLIYFLFNRY